MNLPAGELEVPEQWPSKVPSGTELLPLQTEDRVSILQGSRGLYTQNPQTICVAYSLRG